MHRRPRCLSSALSHPFLLLLILPLLTLPTHAYTPLSDTTLQNLPDSNGAFDIHTGSILSPILQPRVPGTPGSLAVLSHFQQFFQTHLPQWTVELQNSTSTTPATGDRQIPFVNVIATRDPPWARPGEVGRLALVAHYDSKMKPDGFIGATDSAAPCAVILHAAKSVDEALTRKWKRVKEERDRGRDGGDGLEDEVEGEQGVQIILLDGEEAFLNWSDGDSLYGARSLAETWEQTPHAALSTYKTPLSSITLFVLLDLLGGPNPTVPSYFPTTHWAYTHLADLEKRLRNLSLMISSPNHPSQTARAQAQQRSGRAAALPEPHFLPGTPGGLFQIGDDHVPFLQRGVEVLHLIPYPFPAVWHKLEDDGDHLDLNTVEDWGRLITGFVAEWMDLEGFFVVKKGKRDGLGGKGGGGGAAKERSGAKTEL